MVVVMFTLIHLALATMRAKTWTFEEIILQAFNNVLVGATAVVVHFTVNAPAMPGANLAALAVVDVLLTFSHSVPTTYYRVLKDGFPAIPRPYLSCLPSHWDGGRLVGATDDYVVTGG